MVSRRTFLAGTAAGTLGGLALTGTAAAGPSAPPPAEPVGPEVAHTLRRDRLTDGRSTRVGETGFPLTHLAVAWAGAGDAAGIRLRTRSGWGDWQPVRGCGAGRDGAGERSSAVLVASDVVGYELQSPAGTAVTELNTVDGPVRGRAAASDPEMALQQAEPVECRYLTRAAWGADETLRFAPDRTERFPASYHPVQTVTVHHTATANGDPDPAATMRSIQFQHTITRDFGDFGYHLVIDEAGRVYEGRWSGDDPLPVFGPTPGPDGRPLMNNSAHARGFNAGNVGVALLGDLTDVPPTEEARRTLVRVLAGLLTATGLDPLATAAYVNPISGATRTVPVLPGHRDWLATDCPGNTFAPTLEQVRRDVADLIGTPPAPPT